MGYRCHVALTAKGQATRERIIEGAAAYLASDEPGEVTLDDIRAITGTSKSQIFHYFPGGKEELLLEVARTNPSASSTTSSLTSAPSPPGPRGALAGRRRGPLPGARTELPARRAHGPGRQHPARPRSSLLS